MENPTTAAYRWRWVAFSAVMISAVMDLLDSTVVNVAAPSIRGDLGGSYTDLQWIAASYTLAMAVVLLTGGRLGDMFGRGLLLKVGVAGFTVASLACSLAWSPGSLIGFRLIQGVFAGMMLPQGFGLIRDLFPAEQIAKVFVAFGPIMGLSAVLGPIVGGAIIDWDLFGTGWRLIFALNVPLGLLALGIAIKFFPQQQGDHSIKLDLVGAVLGGAAMSMLVYPLVQGRELDWPAWIIALAVASVPVWVLFFWYEARRARSGNTPLIELSVFKKRSYSSGVIFALAFFVCFGGTLLVLGVYLQAGLAFTPIHASLALAPWALGSFFGSGFSGAMMEKLGRHLLHIGLTLMAAGLLGLWFVLGSTGADVSHWDLAAPLLVSGIGMGMIFVPMFDIILGGVEDHEVGSASGALESFQQLGVSLGVAILGTVFFGLLGPLSNDTFDEVAAPQVRAALTAAQVPADAQPPIVQGLRQCLHDRETATDPDTIPASCAPPQGADPALGVRLQSIALTAHKEVATDSARTTVLSTCAFILLAFLLGFFLPKKARPHESTPTEAAESALVAEPAKT